MDYSYFDYQQRQHYYSTYHPQILPSTLSTFESDLPFYSTTFGTAPSTYNGGLYYSPDPPMGSNAYSGPPMAPVPNRLFINDANNNSFGKFVPVLTETGKINPKINFQHHTTSLCRLISKPKPVRIQHARQLQQCRLQSHPTKVFHLKCRHHTLKLLNRRHTTIIPKQKSNTLR